MTRAAPRLAFPPASQDACPSGRDSPELPEQDTARREPWSADELRQFLAVADADRLAAAWQLSLYGLRRGEVRGLRWDDIDLDARMVTICRARVVVGAQVIAKSPKSERGARELPLDDNLTAALRALHDRQATEAMEAPEAYSASGYVVTDELGAAVNPEWFTDEFRRLAATAGLPPIRLHDVRHTVNSLLASKNAPAHIRAAWCGHTVAVNVSTYTHSDSEGIAAAGAVLSTILRPDVTRA